MRHLIGVLADDLTGANDTGVQFALCGLKTMVYLKGLSRYNYADVLVLNSDSRQMSAQEARKCTYDCAKALLDAGAERIYKKLDSVLRGNIGAELDAVMDACECKTAFLCLAYPRIQRTVEDGAVMVGGVPLSSTVLSQDWLSPVKSASIAEVIAEQSSRRTTRISLAQIREGEDKLSSLLTSMVGREEIVIFDAQTEADVHVIGNVLDDLEGSFVVAGSGGLACALAQASTSVMMPFHVAGKSALIVCGTPNKMAQNQIAYLERMGKIVRYIQQRDLLQGKWDAGPIAEDLQRNGIGILSICEESYQTGSKETGMRVRECLADYVTSIFNQKIPDALILTGGDTALSICLKLQGWSIDLLGEIEVGVPYGLLQSNWMQNLTIVTKSGSFGDEKTLNHAVDFLLKPHAELSINHWDWA